MSLWASRMESCQCHYSNWLTLHSIPTRSSVDKAPRRTRWSKARNHPQLRARAKRTHAKPPRLPKDPHPPYLHLHLSLSSQSPREERTPSCPRGKRENNARKSTSHQPNPRRQSSIHSIPQVSLICCRQSSSLFLGP